MFFFPFCLCVDQECWADPWFVSGIGRAEALKVFVDAFEKG